MILPLKSKLFFRQNDDHNLRSAFFRIVAFRGLAGIVVLWATVTFTFLAMHFSSGDPALAVLGDPGAMPTQAVLERVRHEYGFDLPLWTQYQEYIFKLLHGDFGQSYRERVPAATVVREQIGSTLVLASIAGPAAVAIALLSATLTTARNRWITGLVSCFEMMATSIPSFVSGLMLMLVVSLYIGFFPITGGHGWRSLVLPSITLAIPLGALLSQLLRDEFTRVLEQPFIVTARTRGLSDLGVRLGHALRHILVTLITFSGFMFGWLLGSTVIVETLFARPGIGRLMADSAMSADAPVVSAIALLSACFYVAFTLLADLLAMIADPRLAQN